MKLSKHQEQRRKRQERILANVGSRGRSFRKIWGPTIAFYDAQIAYLKELMKLHEAGVNPLVGMMKQEESK